MGDVEDSRRASWATRHPVQLVLVLIAGAVGAVILGMWGFVSMLPDLSWGGQARRPLEYPRDVTTMNEIVEWVHANGNCNDYYVELPHNFDAFTAGGLTSCWGDAVFLPQWSGIPDDAGGYWYSPGESPDGWDMWGMLCKNPVDLGEGWWTCGMAD